MQAKMWQVWGTKEFSKETSYSRFITEDVSDPDIDHHWTQDMIKLESVILGEPKKLSAHCKPICQFQYLSPFLFPKFIEDLIKLNKVNEFSELHQYVLRPKLMSQNGWELDGFCNQSFQLLKLFKIPSLKILQTHTSITTFISLQHYYIFVFEF